MARPVSLRSPLRWAGGKSRVRDLITRALPDHRAYVEPFGGAGSVLLAKSPAPVEVYNDLDGELVNFFRALRDDPDGLLRAFRWALVSRNEYVRLAGLDPAKLTPTERAYRFYYLVMANWGAESGRFRFQASISGGGGGNRLIGALANLEKRFVPVHRRLQRVIIEELPWQEVLERYDGPDTAFYLDPPYPGHQVSYGVNMRSLDEHRALWRSLKRLEGRWLLSTYDDPELRREMGRILGEGVGFYPIKVQWGLPSPASVRHRELLVANYPVPQGLLRTNPATAPAATPLFDHAI